MFQAIENGHFPLQVLIIQQNRCTCSGAWDSCSLQLAAHWSGIFLPMVMSLLSRARICVFDSQMALVHFSSSTKFRIIKHTWADNLICTTHPASKQMEKASHTLHCRSTCCICGPNQGFTCTYHLHEWHPNLGHQKYCKQKLFPGASFEK